MTKPDLVDQLAAEIHPLLAAQHSILVGLSGGMDSVVLLHILHQLAPRFSWRLSALHVHHGISPHADAWANFCSQLCAHYQIPLQVEQVDIEPLREHGIEAAARKLRHAAFAKQPCDVVALAHHADDQVETLLLQLLRGAGVRGASAMPLLMRRANSPHVLRPLLHCSRREILAYANAQQLRWIEDESNADDSYPRNFLRHQVLPVLEERFPAYRNTLARSTAHFAEAGDLLNELAQQDAVGTIHAGTLSVAVLSALSPARAKNLLRYFLHSMGTSLPQAVQLDDMLQQLCSARDDANVCVSYGDWQVRRYQDRIHVLPALPEFDSKLVLSWQGEAELAWPALSARLQFRLGQFKETPSISMAKLRHAAVTLRLRQGGEALRPYLNGATRTLKNLLQEQQVPPWHRDRLPLLYCGDELVCVLGIAIAAEYQAAAGEEGLQLSFFQAKK